MSSIEVVSPFDLEYREFKRDYPNENSKFLTKLLDSYGYDIHQQEEKDWIRSKKRYKGRSKSQYFEILQVIDNGNFKIQKIFDFLSKYRNSKYYETHKKLFSAKDYKSISEKFESLKHEKGHKRYYMYSFLSSLLNPDYLLEYLKNNLFPTFFEEYPKGKIVVLLQNDSMEKELSFIRNGFLLEHYDFHEIKDLMINGNQILKNWQNVDATNALKLILSIYESIFYPHIHSTTIGSLGISFLLIFDSPLKNQFQAFPTDWTQFLLSPASFAGEAVDIKKFLEEFDKDEKNKLEHRKFLHTKYPSSDENLELFTWFTEIVNNIYNDNLDPCNFLINDQVSFTTCFEFNLTFDRILRKTLSCYLSREPNSAKGYLFEIADLYDTLFYLFTKTKSVFFKNLFKPSVIIPLVSDCLVTTPAIVKNHLNQINKDIYNELSQTVLDSIWLKDKINASNQISVRNKQLTGENLEDLDDFIANYMRALRNTHHGYFTELDPIKNPARYFILTNGNIPDSITYLPMIWLLAFISNPNKFINFNTLKYNQEISL